LEAPGVALYRAAFDLACASASCAAYAETTGALGISRLRTSPLAEGVEWLPTETIHVHDGLICQLSRQHWLGHLGLFSLRE